MKAYITPPPGYLNVKQYCEMTGFKSQKVRSAISEGRLAAERTADGSVIIKADAVFNYKPRGRKAGGVPKIYQDNIIESVSRIQMPKCPSLSCLINDRGRCANLTECLYYKHKDGRTYCSMAKY